MEIEVPDCGKIRYYTVKEARKALKQLRFRDRPATFFYKCQTCSIPVYHITSQKKSKGKNYNQ